MSLTSNSMSSGISLFDELSSVNHDLMPEELSSTYSDSCEVGLFIYHSSIVTCTYCKVLVINSNVRKL